MPIITEQASNVVYETPSCPVRISTDRHFHCSLHSACMSLEVCDPAACTVCLAWLPRVWSTSLSLQPILTDTTLQLQTWTRQEGCLPSTISRSAGGTPPWAQP
ncbi:hypothetical protein Pcinc_028220 [Petrolisthes cinctipes]|uniref:Uncharacterized protein n=1 Tax=Petrolisthes cinctipes TaxID=88211 RepID=A0AAE1F3K6_PETCI|nr:hypothetical protein Pcinc_028220 [Petrolisthes cinctipes]